jgi:DNA polymerase-1
LVEGVLASCTSFLFRIAMASRSLVLLDANHLMHRAYWAIQRSLSTSSGEQTNAVFGVASMLLTILRQEKPDAIIACFDEGSETIRHQEHEEYKAGRQETPDDFYDQIDRVYQCLETFAIPTVSDPEYEADDLLGTFATIGAKEGWNVTIVTGDRDLFQMPNGNIRVAVPHKGYSEPEYLDAKGVEIKLGVPPERVPDYKGLVGDSSDNLKGVNGIGPKTATKLLQTYETLEGIYEHLPQIRESVQQKLKQDKESAFFCKKMATLITDIPVTLSLSEVADRKAHLVEVEALFKELEFYTLRTRLKKALASDAFFQTYFDDASLGDVLEEEADVNERSQMTVEQLPLLD